MDTKNIAALSAMLIRTGFEESISYRLLQRICFHPGSFTLVERLQKNKDILTCVLHFERSGMEYLCGYYDISLLKGIVMPDRMLGAVNLQELDVTMGNINWSFNPDSSNFRLDNEKTWQREKEIAQVVNLLTRLSATEEGKYFADALKLKHWSDAGLEELIGNLNAIKAKFDISQRVYFIDGESLSVDEAYRFLLNSWMQKKMQAKKREQSKESQGNNSDADIEARGKNMLQKKRKIKARQITRQRRDLGHE